MNVGRIGRGEQIKIYIGKCFRLFKNERQWTNFISTALILVIICWVTSADMFANYADTRTGVFALICACIWVGLFNSIQSVVRERDIVKREYRTGLHISSYVLAHVIYEAVICAVESFIIILIVYIRNAGNFPEEGLIFPAVVDIYITFLLVVFGADMIAVLISCIVRRENTAMTVMPFVLIIQLVLAGVIFTLEGLAEKISHLTLSKWGLNAVISVANTNSQVNFEYEYAGETGCEATASNLAHCWLMLLLFAAIYIVVGIIALKQVDKDTR